MNETGDSRENTSVVADLWRYYGEHAEHARDHETLRATVTSTLTGIAAAVVALAGVGGLSAADLPAGLVVLALSVLGVALSLKHYERFKMHTAVMKEVRAEIDRLQGERFVGVRTTQELRRRGEDRHARDFAVVGSRKNRKSRQMEEPDPSLGDSKTHPSAWVDRVRLHILWVGLPVSVGLIGILVIVLSTVGVAPK